MQIGVDFGGTKIEAAALDAEGRLLSRVRSANPGRYEDAIATVRDLVGRVEREAGSPGTVAVGVPGSVSPTTGAMRNSNSLYLNGRRFREDLSSALGREVRLANDANCFALSEALDGAAAGARIVFGIILGTGCGGGLVIDGDLIEGANGIAGEWGHNSLPWPEADETPGPPCYCGRRGCLEQWISGTGVQRDFRTVAGMELGAQEIIDRARSGDAEAHAAFERLLSRLGRAIASVCNIVDPDVVVFGGGLSNVAEIYERVIPIVRAHVFSDHLSAILTPAKWGDASGVRGAARLWPSVGSPARRWRKTHFNRRAVDDHTSS